MSTRPLWRCVAAVALTGAVACGSPTPGGSPSPTPTPTPTSSTPSAAAGSPTAPASRTPTPPPSHGPTGTSPPAPTPTTTPPPPSPNACDLTAEYRGVDLEVAPTSARVAVLTFDGGASSTGVASILATLSRNGVGATFFLTGDFARAHPDAARAISRAYPVGNHSDTHPDLTTLPSSAVVDEVRDGAAAIRGVTGRATGPWFRFPYGARDTRTIGLVNDECDVAVRWSVDSLGWKGTSGGMTAASVRDRVLAAARPGMIVLMHVGANPTDGTTLDADALPEVITGLQRLGYRFETLAQVL